MNLADKVKQAGVVGAGGGGFPAHVKLAAKADTIIANGAECEPLLHKDAVLMEAEAAALVQGMQLATEAVGAKDGVIGIKAKKKHAVEAATKPARAPPSASICSAIIILPATNTIWFMKSPAA